MSRSAAKMTTGGQTRFWLLDLVPWYVWLTAFFAALTAILPYWHAASQTPAGWTFTGNIGVSPDIMQYRVWIRQAQQEGWLVDNRFTSDPNRPYLPVLYYFAIGKLAQATGSTPEQAYVLMGVLLAFLFTPFLYLVVREFIRPAAQAWWVMLAILLGGGLSGYVKLALGSPLLNSIGPVRRLLLDPFQGVFLFEDLRGGFVVTALIDSHYIAIWFASLVAIFAMYLGLRKPSLVRGLVAGGLAVCVTLLHIYEGVLLLAILASILFLLWRKRLLTREHWLSAGAWAVAIAICMGWQVLLSARSGLPFPSWRGLNPSVVTLLIAYPLAWLVIAWGIAAYWRGATFDGCFLMGWVLGCVLLLLAWPLYPYPDRGTMTLQAALYILAGAIFFGNGLKLSRRAALAAAVVAVILLAGTPIFIASTIWQHTTFGEDKPYMYLSGPQREMIAFLAGRATANDVLIVDKRAADWETDDRWLMPEFPGKLYAGHFFLTPHYAEKRAEVNDFYAEADPAQAAAFLRDRGIRFVYAAPGADAARLAQVPGLSAIKMNRAGVLYEYLPASQLGD